MRPVHIIAAAVLLVALTASLVHAQLLPEYELIDRRPNLKQPQSVHLPEYTYHLSDNRPDLEQDLVDRRVNLRQASIAHRACHERLVARRIRTILFLSDLRPDLEHDLATYRPPVRPSMMEHRVDVHAPGGIQFPMPHEK